MSFRWISWQNRHRRFCVGLIGLFLVLAPTSIVLNLEVLEDTRWGYEVAAFCSDLLNSPSFGSSLVTIQYVGWIVIFCSIYLPDPSRIQYLIGNSEDAQIHRANLLYENGDFLGAIRHYDRALERNPESVRAYTGRGAARFAMDEQAAAIADFQRAIPPGSVDANAYAYRGNGWHLIGDTDAAIADFTEAIYLDPKNVEFLEARAAIRNNQRDIDGALEDVSKALQLNPDSARAYLIRASVHVLKLDYDAALVDLDQAILRDPKNDEFYLLRGQVYYHRGDNSAAIGNLSAAIRRNRHCAPAYETRAVAYLARGDYDKFFADCDTVIRLVPKSNRIYICRGNVHSNRGDYQAAIDDYLMAIRLNSKDADGHNSVAWIYATCPDGQFRDGKLAVENAALACELSDWKNATNIDTLAAAYAECSDWESAINHQQRRIDLATEENEKQRYEGRLRGYQAQQPFRQKNKMTSESITTTDMEGPVNL